VHLAFQVRGQHLRGQRQVVPFGVLDALAPSATDRRNPPGLAGTAVVEPDRVHVGAGREQRAEERHLRIRRRAIVHRPWRCLEKGCLRGPRRRRLLWTELQQPQQPGILGLQPRQFSRDLLGNLDHADNLCAPSDRLSWLVGTRSLGRPRRRSG